MPRAIAPVKPVCTHLLTRPGTCRNCPLRPGNVPGKPPASPAAAKPAPQPPVIRRVQDGKPKRKRPRWWLPAQLLAFAGVVALFLAVAMPRIDPHPPPPPYRLLHFPEGTQPLCTWHQVGQTAQDTGTPLRHWIRCRVVAGLPVWVTGKPVGIAWP